jgi:predicted porin
MKKLLSKPQALALLVLSIAGSANAQSSVSIFGVLDANVGRMKGAPTGVTPTDVSTTRQDSSGLTTSMWGLRGTEDLGGGFSANFELQSFIRNDTGQTGRSDAICAGPPSPAPACSAVNVSADPYFSKAAYVGLGTPELGRVRLGQMTTALWIMSTQTNALADSTTYSPINLLMFIGAPLSGGTGWSQSMAYDSPTWGGVNFNLQKSFAEGAGGGNIGGRLSYAAGPLGLSLGYTNVKKDPVTFSDGTSRNNTKNMLAAVTYDFQVVKVFAHLGRIKSDGSTSATPADDNITHKIWEVSASAPFGQHRLNIAYGVRKGDERFASERRLGAIGYSYFISKRTDVYAVTRFDRNRAMGTAANAVEAKGTSYALGIRHFF